MPDNKPTDNEIIKLLGRLSCKTLNDYELINAAIDLINRLQSTVEDLNIRLTEERHRIDCIDKSYNEIKTEARQEFAEQLKEYFREKAIETFGDMSDSIEYLTIDIEQTEIDIDNLLK